METLTPLCCVLVYCHAKLMLNFKFGSFFEAFHYLFHTPVSNMCVIKVYGGLLFGQQTVQVIASHIMQFGKEHISLNVMVIYFTYTLLLH